MKFKPKLRFGLRSLLFLMLAACLACGYYAWNNKHYAALKTLLENGNKVEWKRELPSWLDRKLGIYRFDSVKRIEPLHEDSDFAAIADLHSLEEFRSVVFNLDLEPLMSSAACKHQSRFRIVQMF